MIKPIEMREVDFKREVEKQPFPESVKDEFFLYWSEPNKSGTKMKFEMEKTWHTGRRIARWAGNQFEGIKKKTITPGPMMKQPAKEATNDFERLDQFLAEYASRPADTKFEKFGKWYEFMKQEKLLKIMTKKEVDDLLTWYNGDKDKCRCACVQMTLDGFVKSNWSIRMIQEMRGRLV